MTPYSIGFVIKATILMVSGIYFFVRYYRKGPPFWLGIILITTGFFDLRFLLERWLEGQDVSSTIHMIVTSIIHLMFVAANTLYHYFVLIFFIDSAGFIKRYLYFVLLLPLLATLFLRTDLYPELTFDYLFVAIWGTVYWIASFAFALREVVLEQGREKRITHIVIALILLSNGFILILAHYQGMEFIELVNMTAFSIFLMICLLLLIWVNMRKMLVGMQREAVVRKMDMGTALLHHTFKNAIGKVKINAWNIRNSISKQKSLPREDVEEINGYVQNLFSTYEHMMGMMAKISQIVRKRMEIKPERVDLTEVLDEAVEVAGQHPRVQIIKQYTTPIPVYIDRALILECLINLLQNAVDAMHAEGTITVSATRERRRTLISVSDNGTGMSKEQKQQVFEPFYSTKGKSGKNMGLGLYYVRKVMEAHKGKVQLQSELGKGTSITLEFKQRRGFNE